MISIDIFMCGSANPNLAMPVIEKFWNPSHVDIKTIRRGKVEPHKLPTELIA